MFSGIDCGYIKGTPFGGAARWVREGVAFRCGGN